MIRLPISVLALPVALSLSPWAAQVQAGPKVDAPSAASADVLDIPTAAEKTGAALEAAAKPEGDAEATDPVEEFNFPEAVDIGGFGSEEPVEREDMPTRGIITFGPETLQHSNGAHWETYMGQPFKAKRWGRYQVRLTYRLSRSSLGMQFRMGNLMVKKSLLSAPVSRKTYLGQLYIDKPGDIAFAMLTAPTESSHFEIQEIALIPTCEGEMPQQAEDGRIVLNAKDAITWSENMRYEPKPEKNCLGFWTSEDDLAEWEFQVTKPGRYKVTVSHGCGGGNHGSEVEVKHDGQSLKFKTEDTGGFQNWKEISLGEIEIKGTGKQRLVIEPVNKVKSAVLDVQKVVLTPLG